MRPLERIDEISHLIKEIWNEMPGMRYMQLIYVLQSNFSERNYEIGKIEGRGDGTDSRIGFDLFHIEDEELKSFLESFLTDLKTNNF